MHPINLIKKVLGVQAKIERKAWISSDYDRITCTFYEFTYNDIYWVVGYAPIKEEVEDYDGNCDFANINNTGEMVVTVRKYHGRDKRTSCVEYPLLFKDNDHRRALYDKYETTNAISNAWFEKALTELIIKGGHDARVAQWKKEGRL